jgi:hypothetical protein
MKQCPVCHEQFDDQELFCDQDGSNLLDQTDSLREALNHAQPRQASSAWITGAIGGFVGVIMCVLLYLLFLAPDPRDADGQDRRSSQTQQTAPVRSAFAAAPAPQTTPPLETASPSPEEEAAASPSPTVAPQTPTAAALNNGPIATGTKQARDGERAIIKMKDGSSVEADAAWEDAQGVWYRRSGLVSFVEKSRVEAITDPPQRQPAKAEVKAP